MIFNYLVFGNLAEMEITSSFEQKLSKKNLFQKMVIQNKQKFKKKL